MMHETLPRHIPQTHAAPMQHTSLQRLHRRILSTLIYVLSSTIGVVAFLYPFWLPAVQKTAVMGMAHANDAPLMLTVLVGLCFVALLIEVQGEAVGAKFVALLGVLVSMNAILRFIEVAVPVPGGFSPVFFLIILTGYVYGGRFGFLMGTMTLFVSALMTGGVGPWLPYQMFTTGWVGLTAPLCGWVVQAFQHLVVAPASSRVRQDTDATGATHATGQCVAPDSPFSLANCLSSDKVQNTVEIVALAVFSAVWGFLYGAIMNIWFWPYATGSVAHYWEPGVGVWDTLQRYALFYVVTSLVWDLFRALGNIALMVAIGGATLRVLRRFKRRFDFSYSS